MGEWFTGFASAAEGTGEAASAASTAGSAAGSAAEGMGSGASLGEVGASSGDAVMNAGSSAGSVPGGWDPNALNSINQVQAARGVEGAGSVNSVDSMNFDRFNTEYYKPFQQGGNKSWNEVEWGKNPETAGYVYKKLDSFSKSAPSPGRAQMMELPQGNRPPQQQREDEFTKLMRFRRR